MLKRAATHVLRLSPSGVLVSIRLMGTRTETVYGHTRNLSSERAEEELAQLLAPAENCAACPVADKVSQSQDCPLAGRPS